MLETTQPAKKTLALKRINGILYLIEYNTDDDDDVRIVE